jgi:hypothetical protein
MRSLKNANVLPQKKERPKINRLPTFLGGWLQADHSGIACQVDQLNTCRQAGAVNQFRLIELSGFDTWCASQYRDTMCLQIG